MAIDFIKLAEQRYSVRKFSGKTIEQEKLDLILRAGRLAPTAKNEQPQRILVLNADDTLEKLKKCTSSHYNCAAALVVCHDETACWERPFDGKKSGDIDAAIVTTHMMLEAAELGIGTTWVMYFDPEAVKTEFELPDNIVPTAILVMGYPADDAVPAPRHEQRFDVEKTVFYNRF